MFSTPSGRCRDHLVWVNPVVGEKPKPLRRRYVAGGFTVWVHLGGDCELEDYEDVNGFHECMHLRKYENIQRAWFGRTALLHTGDDCYVHVADPPVKFALDSRITHFRDWPKKCGSVPIVRLENGKLLNLEKFDFLEAASEEEVSPYILQEYGTRMSRYLTHKCSSVLSCELVIPRCVASRATASLISGLQSLTVLDQDGPFLQLLAANAELVREQCVEECNEQYDLSLCIDFGTYNSKEYLNS